MINILQETGYHSLFFVIFIQSLSLSSFSFESTKEKNRPVNHDNIPIFYNTSLNNRRVMHWWTSFFGGIHLKKLFKLYIETIKTDYNGIRICLNLII